MTCSRIRAPGCFVFVETHGSDELNGSTSPGIILAASGETTASDDFDATASTWKVRAVPSSAPGVPFFGRQRHTPVGGGAFLVGGRREALRSAVISSVISPRATSSGGRIGGGGGGGGGGSRA